MSLDLVTVLAPEIAMVVIGLAALLVDVTLLRAWPSARRTRWLCIGAALGLAGVTALLAQHLVWADALYAHGVLFADPARVLVVDRLGLTVKLLIVLLTLATLLLSVGYEMTRHVGEYVCLTLFAATGMSLLVTTESFLMLFVALELLSLCLYVLTAFHKGLLRSSEAAVKYFMFGAVSSAFLLFGLSWVVGSTGAGDMRALAAHLTSAMASGTAPSPMLVVGLVFVLVGVGFKLAVVPFHLWAPDAYEGAPTPVAAFIASGSKVASFAVGAKLLLIGFGALGGGALVTVAGPRPVAGWVPLLAIVATLSMVWGSLAAIVQKNAKRLLAYSSIAHAGTILIGVLAVSRDGVVGAHFYLVTYALANLGAFGVIAALTRAAGGDDLEDLDGMARRAPLLSLLLLVFVLSLAGIPPLSGFLGKLLVFGAAVRAHPDDLGLLWIVVVAIAASAVSLYYYMTLLKHVYVHAPRDGAPARASLSAYVTLVVLGLAVVGLGVWPEPLLAALADFVDAAGILAPPR